MTYIKNLNILYFFYRTGGFAKPDSNFDPDWYVLTQVH
jgi:hypothetical protein